MEMNIKLDYSDVKFKDNGKLKLLIIVGTRPEIIRLAAVINKCRTYFDTILAHTGQNYDYNLNGVFFKDLKLADPEVYMDAVGDDLGATVGKDVGRERVKGLVVAYNKAWLVERANQIFSLGNVYRGLAAHRGVNRREKCGGYLNEFYAAQIYRRRKARKVAHNSAAEGDKKV